MKSWILIKLKINHFNQIFIQSYQSYLISHILNTILKIKYFNEVFYYNINKTPFYLAVESGNIEVVKLLLSNTKANIDVNKVILSQIF